MKYEKIRVYSFVYFCLFNNLVYFCYMIKYFLNARKIDKFFFVQASVFFKDLLDFKFCLDIGLRLKKWSECWKMEIRNSIIYLIIQYCEVVLHVLQSKIFWDKNRIILII